MILSILTSLFWPIVIVGFIIFLKSRGKKSHKPFSLIPSHESISQLFLVLTVIFFGFTLASLNTQLTFPIELHFILLFSTIVSFVIAYRYKSLLVLIIGIMGIVSWWFEYSPELSHKISLVVFIGFVMISLIFYVVGHIHLKSKTYKHFSLPFILPGLFSIIAMLFTVSTKVGLVGLDELLRGQSISPRLLWVLVFFGVILGSALLYSKSKKAMLNTELLAVYAVIILCGSLLFFPEHEVLVKGGYRAKSVLTSAGILFAVIFNILIFAESLGMMFVGIARKSVWRVNVGAFFLFLLIFIKYLDWFFTFLDKSIFFIGAGILLLGVGYFMERGRKYMLSEMKK